MNWMAKVSLILIFTVFLSIYLFSPDEAAAATYYSRVTGNWNANATWSTAACAGAAAAAFPVAGDTVTICSGNTVTLAVAAAATNLTITSGTLAGAGFAVTLTGNYTNNGTHSGTAGATLSGAAMTIDGTGLVTNTGTFTISGTKTIAATANLTFSGIVTCSAAVTNNGIVTITNTGAGRLAGASSWTQGANSTLNYAGSTITITTFTPTGAGNTVNYNGAVAQTVFNVNNYQNLTLSGTSAKTLGALMVTIGGNLTLSGTATATTVAVLAITGNVNVGDGTTLTVAGFNFTVTGTTTVGGGTSGTLTHSSVTGTKTFTGLVTINSGGQWTNTINEEINFRGGLTNNGTFTAGTGIYTFTINNQEIGGTSATTIPNVTVTTITLTNNITTGAGLTVSTALIGTGGLTQGTNAVLTIGGTSTVTTLTATASGNTVNYNANGAQAACKVTTYNNLTLSVAGAKTFATTPTVNGILSIEGTATVVATTGVVTYGANATLQYNTTTARTSTAEEWITPFAATGGIIIASTGAITPDAAKVFNASVPLTINSGATLATNNLGLTLGGNFVNGGTFTAGSSVITISGNWTNTGTFTAGTSTVTFNGTGNQSISGSNTWYNLSITAAAKRTVKFASGATQAIAAGGLLTLTGASPAQPLTLAPSVGTTAWLLNRITANAPSISNVAVSFSDASSGGLIDASNGTNSNAGNNTNWNFGTSGSIVSCVGCHGYGAFPDGTSRNTPDGTFQGTHNKHVVTYSKVCSVCHTVPAGETSPDFAHRNGTIQMADPINSNTNARYSKAASSPYSFVQTNAAFSGGTCSNTYCHSNGTSVITATIPVNNSTAWGGTAACTSCHGVGGGDDGRPNYANNSPKRNTHGVGVYGVTHKATACPTCHMGVSGSAGAYTVDPATHNDGTTYNLNGSMGYNQPAGTCGTQSCHASATWGETPCLACHITAQDAGDGAPTRRAMSTELTNLAWSHKKTAAGTWTNNDCGVCHMEGDPATGKTTAYHRNNLLEFRDPDTGATIQGVTFTAGNVQGSYTSGSATSAATFARNTGSNTLEAFAQAVQVNLCLKCHDGAGAASTLAWVPGGTALKPFGTAGGTVLDMNAHFATGNASYHPVSGRQNNSYADVNTMAAPWNTAGSPGGTKTTKTALTNWGWLMTCWDCHDSSAAARTIGGTTASSTAHGSAVTLRAPYNATSKYATPLCVVCHKQSVYWGVNGGTAQNQGYTHMPGLGFSANNGDSGPSEWASGGYHDLNTYAYYGCTVCHGMTDRVGVLPARPARAENAHGSNTIGTGGTTWPTSGARPYSFYRNTTTHADWNLSTRTCDMNGSNACRGTTGVYTPGGTY